MDADTSSDMMDLTLPFGPDGRDQRTWKLDSSKKAAARDLASRIGINYSNAASPVPTLASHPHLFEQARNAIASVGGPEFVNPDEIVQKKMQIKDPEESLFVNVVAGLCGFLVFDLPDGLGGFVLLDPKNDRTTAWHPSKHIREAACVCGSLVLREAKKRGNKEVEDLADALSSLAVDPETGLMRDLEAAMKGVGLESKKENEMEEEPETITLQQVDLPPQGPGSWLSFPKAAGAAQ
ncbi:hypothetical protein HDU85_003590 [Gaertneriomyces sp. JEL0708]|nr:hypothetical protein HDU85_003590 [Gaertneriomyces sp. JEL0708]